ncbi:hypothetical protein H8356DRAFT_1321374 [Neocallimastix lanati (nom. inval.)]|nr:hypothetical protein H8356DRAFT_1321374 [Neocallimastix sp. JGI-2020a]
MYSKLADHIETQNYGNSELMLGFQRGGVVADEDKFNYIIIAAAEDDIVRVLREKKDKCVDIIKTKYWRENQKIDILKPNESVYDFNTRLFRPEKRVETKKLYLRKGSHGRSGYFDESLNRTNRNVVNDPINSHFHKYNHSSPSNLSLNYNYYPHNSSRNAFNIERTNHSNRNGVRNSNPSTHEPGKYNSNNDDGVNDFINRMQHLQRYN